MSHNRPVPLGEKLIGGVLVLLVILVGGWAVYRFGPKPTGPASQPNPDATTHTPPARPEQAPTEQPAGRAGAALQAEKIFDLLKPSVTSGRADEGPDEYLSRLEGLYRSRGYADVSAASKARGRAGGRRTPVRKIYWPLRAPETGEVTVTAFGDDPNPHGAERAANPYMCATKVAPAAGGGTEWVTHCLDKLNAEAARSSSPAAALDLSGVDPPGIPREPSLRRLFGFASPGTSGRDSMTIYTSDETPARLVQWYMKTMPPNWLHEPLPADQFKALAESALGFTQGQRFCMVWIKAGGAGQPTTVVISLQQ